MGGVPSEYCGVLRLHPAVLVAPPVQRGLRDLRVPQHLAHLLLFAEQSIGLAQLPDDLLRNAVPKARSPRAARELIADGTHPQTSACLIGRPLKVERDVAAADVALVVHQPAGDRGHTSELGGRVPVPGGNRVGVATLVGMLCSNRLVGALGRGLCGCGLQFAA
jgi:hypothetical protein